MENALISPDKQDLIDWVINLWGGLRTDSIPKHLFLHELWNAICPTTQWNRQNPLIENAVLDQERTGLIPRSFMILSVLYGSYHGQPNKASIMKDFIGLLERDFDQEELLVCEYADSKVDTYFIELYEVWVKIRELYGSPVFNLAVLPPTPYYAYALLVLNRPSEVRSDISLIELSNELCELHSLMVQAKKLAGPRY